MKFSFKYYYHKIELMKVGVSFIDIKGILLHMHPHVHPMVMHMGAYAPKGKISSSWGEPTLKLLKLNNS